MNIWIINHHAMDSNRHFNFSKILASCGYKVTLFASSFKHNQYKETIEYKSNEFYKTEIKDDYKIIWIKTPSYFSTGLKRIINQIVFALRTILVGKKFTFLI